MRLDELTQIRSAIVAYMDFTAHNGDGAETSNKIKFKIYKT